MMIVCHRFGWFTLCVVFASLSAIRAGDPPNTHGSAQHDLSQYVRSILSNRCFACHGPDEAERQAGLRLDEASSMLSPADSGERPVIPGKPEQSELLRRIVTGDEDERMPPADFGQRLLPAEVKAIEVWISQGAQLPQHWSFIAPHHPLPPAIDTTTPSTLNLQDSWMQHPIDRFVLARQLERNMQPSPAATRAELLRRLSLDLIGLPPTPEEVSLFEQDMSATAYECQVDRLLASPAYGEHWARKWLDLARYADSSGYADDPARTIWAYRDWVIDAINANMPIDQFTIEQIAGDLLPNPTQPQLVATAFHRNTLTNNEGGTNDEEFRSVAIVDRVNTTLAVWMGVTMTCAQCHTHKYDPFTHEEYFKLYAIFNQSQDADRKDESPALDLYSDQQHVQRRQNEDRIAAINALFEEPSSEVLRGLSQWESTLSEPIWTNLQPLSLKSERDSDVRIDDDQSIHVRPTANNIVSDTYSLTLKSAATEKRYLQALGLRTLPSPDLPGGGAGTSGTGQNGGNFVVTNVSATIVTAADTNQTGEAPSAPRKIRFTAAYADYAQNGFAASHVIDEDKSSGWAVGGEVVRSHLLTLIPEEPIELAPDENLKIEIDHNSSHRHHLLGSFLLQLSESDRVSQWLQLDREQLATLQQARDQRTKHEQRALEVAYSRRFAQENEPLRKELKALEQQLAQLKALTSVPIIRELEEQSRRETFIQIRGNYKALGDKVEPGVPAVFHPLANPGQTPDRLALAQWLVDHRNPLTARVWANRLWESLFGIGIVRSSEEFGSQGDRPTHPELLDWLACELMEQQWDTKRLLRLMVTSETYRQTSRVTVENLELDQENIWLARGPRVRLSAEMVRDQALSIAGLLSHRFYGPPVRPPQPNLGLKAAFGSDTDWTTSEGEDRYRRGLYTTWRRSNPYPSMATFDAPSREVCTLRRDSTNTPLQALVTLNDPGFVEAAQGLARRVVLTHLASQSSRDDLAAMQYAFQLCTSRAASEPEIRALLELLTIARAHFDRDHTAAKHMATDPLGPVADETQVIELAAWTSVCNVLLNLDEVLMKR